MTWHAAYARSAGLNHGGGLVQEDFTLRRRMLLKRVDVTLQSFLWADKAQGDQPPPPPPDCRFPLPLASFSYHTNTVPLCLDS